jgi:N-acetylneuraminic acid mutarotase
MKSFPGIALSLILILFAGCDENEKPTVRHDINGFVQKGPFILGSTITIIELSSSYAPTGKTFTTTTADDLGSFSTSVELISSKVELIASGYYFNEVSGELSEGPLTLHAVVDLASNASINLNALTTVTKSRILALVDGGANFADAKAQAEGEFRATFGAPSTAGFETLNVTSDALLLAFSAVLQQNRKVAEMTQLLNQIAAEFGATAMISSTSREALSASAMQVSVATVRENLTKKYNDLGLALTLPAFEDALRLFLVGDASLSPRITAVTPSTGIAGDTITITGKNFSIDLKQNHINFEGEWGSIPVELTSCTSESIKFIVPLLNGPTGFYLRVDGHNNMAAGAFAIAPLTIMGFQPTSGRVDDLITISGGPFSLKNDHNFVKFGTVKATIVEATRTTLKVKVPAEAPASSKISIESVYRTSAAEGEFVITPPTVTSMSPNVARVGDVLEIQGSGFRSLGIEITVDGYAANVVSIVEDRIRINVPDYPVYSSRNVGVVVKSDGKPVSAAIPLQIRGWIGVASLAGQPAGSFSVGGKGYIGQGYSSDYWSFDPAVMKVNKIASFPIVSSQYEEPTSFVIGDKVYVCSGHDAESYRDFSFYTYDPQQNNWSFATRLQIDSNVPSGSLVEAVVANGKSYVMMVNSRYTSQAFWEYDPSTDQWTAKEDKPSGWDAEGAFELNGKVYIYSERVDRPNGSPPILPEFWEYDPSTSTWASKAVLENAGDGLAAFSKDGFGYLIASNGFYRYSPGADTWTKLTTPPFYGAYSRVFFKIGDKIYLGQGKQSYNAPMILYEYDFSE